MRTRSSSMYNVMSVYDAVIIMMISSAVYNAIMMMMMMNIIILVLWLSCNVEQLGLLFKWAMSINSTLYLLDINQPPISLGPRTPLLQTAHFTFCLNRRSAPRPPTFFSSASTLGCQEVPKNSFQTFFFFKGSLP